MPRKSQKSLFLTDYEQWLKNEIAYQDELIALRQTAETECGPVEYALLGEGPVVLALHGMPGGYDQGLFGFDWIADAGFSLLAPSRPGYLGTPISTGRTYPEMADAFAALLDTLGIKKAAVVSISGGGPAAYEFAIRHPDRIPALVAIDSIVKKTPMPADFNAITQALYLSAPGEALLSFFSRHFPRQTLQELIKSNSVMTAAQAGEQAEVAMKDPHQLAMLLRIMRSMSDYAKRKAGAENDIAQFTELADMPVERIRCPSLIVHGTHDNLLFYQAVYARDTIPYAEAIWIPEGSHFGAWISPHAQKTRQQIVGFLKNHCGDRK